MNRFDKILCQVHKHISESITRNDGEYTSFGDCDRVAHLAVQWAIAVESAVTKARLPTPPNGSAKIHIVEPNQEEPK